MDYVTYICERFVLEMHVQPWAYPAFGPALVLSYTLHEDTYTKQLFIWRSIQSVTSRHEGSARTSRYSCLMKNEHWLLQHKTLLNCPEQTARTSPDDPVFSSSLLYDDPQTLDETAQPVGPNSLEELLYFTEYGACLAENDWSMDYWDPYGLDEGLRDIIATCVPVSAHPEVDPEGGVQHCVTGVPTQALVILRSPTADLTPPPGILSPAPTYSGGNSPPDDHGVSADDHVGLLLNSTESTLNPVYVSFRRVDQLDAQAVLDISRLLQSNAEQVLKPDLVQSNNDKSDVEKNNSSGSSSSNIKQQLLPVQHGEDLHVPQPPKNLTVEDEESEDDAASLIQHEDQHGSTNDLRHQVWVIQGMLTEFLTDLSTVFLLFGARSPGTLRTFRQCGACQKLKTDASIVCTDPYDTFTTSEMSLVVIR
uniref:Uncharacterized protein n=1 Tax=Timema shepardi TaxID=629360 RepID=A0A7R9G139_TIMSH|nr:unnamed protein product [Timema shepardi]